jgi:hypothetical protein
MPEGSKLWNIVSEVFCIFMRFLEYDLRQGVAMNISNGDGYGEGE